MLRLKHPFRLNTAMGATVVSWSAAGVALCLLGWIVAQPGPLFVVGAGLFAIGCAVVIAGLALQTVGVVLVALFCLTASWDLVLVAGVSVRQLCLLLGGLLLATGLDLRRLPPVPWWLHAYGLSAVVAVMLQTLFPIDPSYLAGRYATSSLGLALGERASPLSHLMSLLFNNYAAPLVVVAACMYAPRALRWFIGAYVLGAAMSCFAGILGYYGHPEIVDIIGGLPTPAGQRIAGFTSHSLRLATSGVMAIGLASWMALQPNFGLKWAGRISVPTLIMGLYLSGSRGGIVAGMLVVILTMPLLPEIRSRLHVVASAVGAALLGVYLFIPNVVYDTLGKTRIFGDKSATISDIGRAEVFDQGIRDFFTSPVYGVGVRFIAEAHVLYVGILASGGIIFAIGYFLFNVGSIRASVQAISVDRGLGGALLATLIASLWYWTVADLIQTKTVAIIYGFVIALWWQGHGDRVESKSGKLASSSHIPEDVGQA